MGNGQVTVSYPDSSKACKNGRLRSCLTPFVSTAVISYFLSAVLDTAGITNPLDQTNVNIGLNCVSFLLAVIGTCFVDRIGRRPLLLFVNAGCCLTWVALTIVTADYAHTGSSASAKATIAFVYVFGAIYAAGFNPLLVLYPVEVLSFEMRAKGMAFSYLTGGIGKSGCLLFPNL